MNNQYLYLLINGLVISVPLIASFYPKHPFYKQWKFVFPSILIVAVFFIIWDVYFTKLGVWGFNKKYVTGIYYFHLPIEEILFFIFIPYACTFTYFSIKILFKTNIFLQQNHQKITLILLSISLLVAFIFFKKYYTFSTFGFLSIFLIVLLFQRYNLSYFYLAFCFIIFFFLITNGVLTGSFIEEEVVWYNNQQNLQIRIGTIPIEDFFYGFLLCAFNVRLYDYFKNKNSLGLSTEE